MRRGSLARPGSRRSLDAAEAPSVPIPLMVFVAGRLIHTLVQTLTEDVRLRGRVFMINTLAVVVLAAHVGMLAFEGIGR